ncbi:hypothetical protein ACQPXH_02480 [Nocardia sp. CA-135953]|uniref:hypothetical protein n=1 Tax=Nocardia sp. CA-135953 TaxID=3239978 RepID=UPI003D96147F
MSGQIPDLLTGTELALIGFVGKANNSAGLPRWQQVHFNQDVARQFFSLEPGDDRSITLEKLSAAGFVVERVSKRLVFSESNKNPKIEFRFGPRDMMYPPDPQRPLLVVVEASYLTYRYRTLMPEDAGHAEIERLLLAGPSLGRGLHRRIVTLDDVEASWPQAALRGGV